MGPEPAGVLDLLLSGSPEVWGPAGLSLLCAAAAAVLATPLGIPAGLLAGAGPDRWRRPLRTVVDAGLAVPTTAIALVLYLLLARRGWFGSAGLLYTPSAIVLGQMLVALPVVVLVVADASASLDPRVHWTARTLGASRPRRMAWYAGEKETSHALKWAGYNHAIRPNIAHVGRMPYTSRRHLNG